MNQREIASTLGVSQTAVSFVLKNPNTEKVSAKRRQQILEFAKKSNYRHRQEFDRNGTICYINRDTKKNVYQSFYDRFIRGVESAVREANHITLMHTVIEDDNMTLPTGKFDGIIYAGRISEELLDRLSCHNLVLLNSTHKTTRPICDSVETDDENGVEIAFQHLLENGHRRIAYLTLFPVEPPVPLSGHYSSRQNAYLNACRYHGIEIRDEYICRSSCAWNISETEKCIEQCLDSLGALASPPTAIICFNDLYAMLLIRQAVKKGLSLPRDLSIIGTDNIPEGILTTPALTSVDHNPEEMCRLAVETLLKRIEQPDRPAKRINCPANLVSRESVSKI